MVNVDGVEGYWETDCNWTPISLTWPGLFNSDIGIGVWQVFISGNCFAMDLNNGDITNLGLHPLGEFLGSNPLFDVNSDRAVNFLAFSVVSSAFFYPPRPGLVTALRE